MFKVIHNKSGKLMSTIASTEYFLGKSIHRKIHNGPFAVFREYVNALHYKELLKLNHMENIEIYSCGIIPSIEECLYINCGAIIPKTSCPIGTIFADEVKLLKKLL